MSTAPPHVPGPTRPPSVVTAWPRAAQLALAFLLGLATALVAVYAYGSLRTGSRPTELSHDQPPARHEAKPASDAGDAETAVPVKDAGGVDRGEKKSAGKGARPSGPINVNTATVAELMTLPNIGQVRAEGIVEERAKRPFRSVEDLHRVSGIGPKTIEKLRPLVTVGPDPVKVATKDKDAPAD